MPFALPASDANITAVNAAIDKPRNYVGKNSSAAE